MKFRFLLQELRTAATISHRRHRQQFTHKPEKMHFNFAVSFSRTTADCDDDHIRAGTLYSTAPSSQHFGSVVISISIIELLHHRDITASYIQSIHASTSSSIQHT